MPIANAKATERFNQRQPSCCGRREHGFADVSERLWTKRVFQVSTFLHKVHGAMAMADPCNVLLDDWPFVQILCNVMGRRTD